MPVSRFRMLTKSCQFALRKFHRFSGIVCVDTIGFIGEMKVGRCCERGNGSNTILLGRGPSRLTKARSGLVVVPHRADRKLSGSLGSKTKRVLQAKTQFCRARPSLLVAL